MVLYEYLVDSCEMVFSSPGVLEESMNIYLKYDGTLSVADALTVQVMKNKKVKTILSFDSDFDKVKGIKRIG